MNKFISILGLALLFLCCCCYSEKQRLEEQRLESCRLEEQRLELQKKEVELQKRENQVVESELNLSRALSRRNSFDEDCRSKEEVGVNALERLAQDCRNLPPEELGMSKKAYDSSGHASDMQGLLGPFYFSESEYAIAYGGALSRFTNKPNIYCDFYKKFVAHLVKSSDNKKQTYVWRSTVAIYSHEGIALVDEIAKRAEQCGTNQIFLINTGGHGGEYDRSNPHNNPNLGDISFTKNEREMIEDLPYKVALKDVDKYHAPIVTSSAQHVIMLWCHSIKNTPITEDRERMILTPTYKKISLNRTKPQSIASENFFGPEDWAEYFGDVGNAPKLPADMEQILNAPCPYYQDAKKMGVAKMEKIDMNKPMFSNHTCQFWIDKVNQNTDLKVRDTHLLTLIPKTVNGKPLTLNIFVNLLRNKYIRIASGPGIRWKFYDHGDTPVKESHWVLMTKCVMPESVCKTFAKQKKM